MLRTSDDDDDDDHSKSLSSRSVQLFTLCFYVVSHKNYVHLLSVARMALARMAVVYRQDVND